MSKKDTSGNDGKDKGLAHLLGPTDKNVDYEAREKLIGARVSLLLKQAFFGNLATRLKLVNADEWLQTLATDGRHFYYNSRFVMMLDQKEMEFGFSHEVLHCVYSHSLRRDNRDPQLYNIAADYCVNSDLVRHNIGRKITTIDILYDRQYDGMCSEEIYDKLYENADKIDMNELMKQMLDEHLDGEGEEDGDDDGDGDGDKEGKGRPKMSKEQMKEIADEFKEAVINAASQEPNAGNIPGNVKKMIKDLTEPQMDWRALLETSLTSSIKEDYTWMRPSRKGQHMAAIMPGRNPGQETNIAVAIDTSGSISQEMMKNFLSEIQGIMEAFTAYKLHVFCFDTQVHNPVQYSSDDITDICEYQLGGFGGTDFEPIFEYMKEFEVEVDRLVCFSDGYPFGSWGDPDFVDTLWILHGTTTIEAPFGTTAYYDENK